jgi:hypothetical protein
MQDHPDWRVPLIEFESLKIPGSNDDGSDPVAVASEFVNTFNSLLASTKPIVETLEKLKQLAGSSLNHQLDKYNLRAVVRGAVRKAVFHTERNRELVTTTASFAPAIHVRMGAFAEDLASAFDVSDHVMVARSTVCHRGLKSEELVDPVIADAGRKQRYFDSLNTVIRAMFSRFGRPLVVSDIGAGKAKYSLRRLQIAGVLHLLKEYVVVDPLYAESLSHVEKARKLAVSTGHNFVVNYRARGYPCQIPRSEVMLFSMSLQHVLACGFREFFAKLDSDLVDGGVLVAMVPNPELYSNVFFAASKGYVIHAVTETKAYLYDSFRGVGYVDPRVDWEAFARVAMLHGFGVNYMYGPFVRNPFDVTAAVPHGDASEYMVVLVSRVRGEMGLKVPTRVRLKDPQPHQKPISYPAMADRISHGQYYGPNDHYHFGMNPAQYLFAVKIDGKEGVLTLDGTKWFLETSDFRVAGGRDPECEVNGQVVLQVEVMEDGTVVVVDLLSASNSVGDPCLDVGECCFASRHQWLLMNVVGNHQGFTYNLPSHFEEGVIVVNALSPRCIYFSPSKPIASTMRYVKRQVDFAFPFGVDSGAGDSKVVKFVEIALVGSFMELTAQEVRYEMVNLGKVRVKKLDTIPLSFVGITEVWNIHDVLKRNSVYIPHDVSFEAGAARFQKLLRDAVGFPNAGVAGYSLYGHYGAKCLSNNHSPGTMTGCASCVALARGGPAGVSPDYVQEWPVGGRAFIADRVG